MLEQVKRHRDRIRGRVLDVGSGSYSRYRNLFDYEKYIRMDIQHGENVDIVGDAEAIPFLGESLDAIVCTQVLGDVPNPQKACEEFYRVLKRKGTVLVTESLMNELHDEPKDFWRFTQYGLAHLLEEAGLVDVEIDQRGGYYAVLAQNRIRHLIGKYGLYERSWSRLLNPFLRIYGKWMLFRDQLDRHEASRVFSLGWCAIARKP